MIEESRFWGFLHLGTVWGQLKKEINPTGEQTFEEIKNNWFAVRRTVFPQTLRLSAKQSKLLEYENGTLFIQAHNQKTALEFEKLKRQISYEISERINLKNKHRY